MIATVEVEEGEMETHGIHLSSTNFLTISRVCFALSLTLLAACITQLVIEGGARVDEHTMMGILSDMSVNLFVSSKAWI